jgi:hypothetical protein
MNTSRSNETIMQFDGSGTYHKYLFGMVATNGAMQFATTYQCFWFLDMVASYQHLLKKEDFQIWMLKKNANTSAWVIAEDGNGKVLIKQEIKYTNFRMEQATVWVEGNVILLNNEH